MGDVTSKQTGIITNIQRYCVHDGPGIRTVVFMKGCPLRCIWCANPETQESKPELAQNLGKCLSCGRCAMQCGSGAIALTPEGVKIDREKCVRCFSCVNTCPADALQTFGHWVTVDDLMKAANNGIAWRSHNGITVSGGEPLMQAPFVAEFLHRCRQDGIHTAIETSGCASWESLEQVAAFCDLIFFDVKLMDDERHQKVTGVSNRRILENLKQLRAAFPEVDIIVRTPVIPDVNDSEADLMAIADFLKTIGPIQDYELLPYHRFGTPKYGQIGRKYLLENVASMNKSDIAARNEQLRQQLKL